MRIDQIRYFTFLDGAQSFSEAAKAANITQQGFSRAIAALESIVECRLVERGRQGSQLTDEGVIFMKHAKAILSEHEAAMSEIKSSISYSRFLENISGKVVFTNACMASIGAKLSECGYLKDVETIEIGLSDIGKFDKDDQCYLIADISPEIYSDYESKYRLLPIASGRIGIAANEDLLPLDTEDPIWETLKKLPIGMFDCDASIEIYDEMFKDMQLECIHLKSTNNNVLIRALRNGDLAFLCDSFSWQCFSGEFQKNEHIRFLPIKRPMHSIFGLIRRKPHEISRDDLEFVAALKCLLSSDG